jgi:hypothetical protein
MGQQASAPFVGIGGAFGEVGKASAELVKNVLPLKNVNLPGIGGGGSSGGDSAAPTGAVTAVSGVVHGVPIIGDVVKQDIPIVSDVVSKGGDTLGFDLTDIQSLFKAQNADLTKLVSGLESGGLTDIGKQLTAGNGSLLSSITTGNNSLLSNITSGNNSLLSSITSSTGTLATQLGTVGTDLSSTIRQTSGDITGTVRDSVNASTSLITQSVNRGFDVVDSGIASVDRSIGQVSSQLTQLQSGTFGAINDVTSSLNTGLQGISQNILAAQNNTTQLLMQSQLTAMQLSDRTLTSVDKALQTTLSSTEKAIGSVGGTVQSLGEDISNMQNLIMFGALGAAALYVVTQTQGSGGTIIVR